jgi:hypothetical protein
MYSRTADRLFPDTNRRLNRIERSATMTSSTLFPSTDRIEALLDRLDPTFDGICCVAGCVHHPSYAQPTFTTVRQVT